MATEIMLDLETMGKGPRAAIIAIGAVAFDLNAPDGEDPIKSRFYSEVSLESSVAAGGELSPSTIMWWLQQSEDARKKFALQGKDETAMNVPTITGASLLFTEWCTEHLTSDGSIWGNGSDFDNAILTSAYEGQRRETPWKFWQNSCYRSVKKLRKDIKLQRVGVYHNAVDDAESQALHLIAIMKDINHACQKT